MKVSVVTVTKDDPEGLRKTLQSIATLPCSPYELIVVDGDKIEPQSKEIINELNLTFKVSLIQGQDKSIYHAMNIGQKASTGDFIHYLNSGDWVCGNPYCELVKPSLLPVSSTNAGAFSESTASLSLFGYGYCHQGVILPANHALYNERYKIAADFDMLLNTFPEGLSKLPTLDEGYVVYDLTGVSSRLRYSRDKEILSILFHHRKYLRSLAFLCFAGVKLLFSEKIRMKMRKLK